MHVNADPDSPHHWALHYRKGQRVLLDGVEQRYVIEADDEAGFIVRLKQGSDGRFVHDGDTVQHERLEGRVTIEGARREGGRKFRACGG